VRVLLSGSHGLIGAALAQELASDGHEVVVLARPRRPTSPVPQPSDHGARVEWDPARGAIDRDGLAAGGPYDAVVHLAGAGIGDRRWTERRRQEIVDSRVQATRVLVGALRTLSPVPPVLVSGSAVGIYGDRGDELLDETSDPGTGFLADLCRAWEAEAAAAADVTRVVQLRSGVVLAPRGGALAKQLPLFRLGLGGRLGDGRQYLSWITLRDELAVIRHAIDDDRLCGAVNATSPGPVTNAAFTAALGRVLHRPAVVAVPAVALEVALGAEMTREMILASQRALPARLGAIGHRFADPDIDQAFATLFPHRPVAR
jgi:uncharacterized protein